MDPPPPRKRVGADPNPGWTAAPWAGVPHPSLGAGSGPASRATAAPPPPPRFGASEDADAGDRSTADASTSERAVAAALEPVAWDAYFDEKLDIRGESERDVFRVYARRGGERIEMLEANERRAPSRKENKRDDATATDFRKTETVVLFAHGCAYTALSWATTIAHLSKRLDSRVLLAAFDARHHGESRSGSRLVKTQKNKNEEGVYENHVDVSAERMARDVVCVARIVVHRYSADYSESIQKKPRIKLVLVGHSMGGAAVTNAAATIGDKPSKDASDDFDLRGVVVVDVVEGSAMVSLRNAEFALARRPSSFATRSDAVAWFVRSGLTRNLESARVSAPSQIRLVSETDEDGDAKEDGTIAKQQNSPGRWVWILDARATAPYWRGWFEGLSKTFLSAKCAKLLILADTDRLDTELTIAQMQGKFQTVVVPNAGHAVHEDQPRIMADAVAGFIDRYAS